MYFNITCAFNPQCWKRAFSLLVFGPYPYMNLAVVCLIVCPVVCPLRFVMVFQWIMARPNQKLHQTFSICKVWSPNLFKIVWASPRTCVHAQRVKSCTLFLPIFLVIFLTFWISSAAILKPFLTENEKTEATFQIGIDDAQLFHFIIFFPFW